MNTETLTLLLQWGILYCVAAVALLAFSWWIWKHGRDSGYRDGMREGRSQGIKETNRWWDLASREVRR